MLDFTVIGIPTSARAKGRSRRRWQGRVAAAARGAWSRAEPQVATEVSVTIIFFYFHDTDLDVDNVAKPILDALVGVVYDDDQSVVQLIARKTRLAPGLDIHDASAALAEGLDADMDFVYVRVSGPPDHRIIP